MRKAWLIIILVIVLAVILFIIRSPEDDWIKDERGVWVKHGAPLETPNYVEEQQQIIDCALQLYQDEKDKGIDFSSQCLGTCGDYAVDIVHIPRDETDNLPANQCEAYRKGEVSHFVELDKEGNIVRLR